MDDCITRFLLHDSLYYGVWFSVGIISLFSAGAFWNPEMFLRSYPPDIKQKYGPMSKKARKQLILFAIPVYLFVLGVLVSSTMSLASTCGRLEFLPVFLNDWIILNLFNLVDLLILDWLFFVTLQPNFVILPGTKGMAGYSDYGFHFRGFLKGILYTSFACLVASAITLLLR